MIIKQPVGNNFFLGGPLSEIEPISFSCFNFNNDFNAELIEMSPDFHYFSVSAGDYIHARSRNMLFNWPYSDESGSLGQRLKRTKMAMRLSVIRAERELNSYPIETFIHNQQTYTIPVYDFGIMPTDLKKLSDEPAPKEKPLSIEEPEKEMNVEVFIN